MTYSPLSNPDPSFNAWRGDVPGEASYGDGDGDECIGACGLQGCEREDCRSCEACGAFFDRDLEGGSCETYGPTCGDCPRWVCSGDCCSNDDAYDAWKDDRWSD